MPTTIPSGPGTPTSAPIAPWSHGQWLALGNGFNLPFLSHLTMYYYGCNVHVPEPGAYTARVYVDVPAFARHDKVNGKRYGEPVCVEFSGIRIKPGRK